MEPPDTTGIFSNPNLTVNLSLTPAQTAVPSSSGGKFGWSVTEILMDILNLTLTA